MAGEPCGQHAVKEIDPQRDGLHHPNGIAQAHQVARGVLREEREGRSQRAQHLVARLANGQPTDGVAVEADGHRALGALAPQRMVGATLDDAELAEVGTIASQEVPSGQLCPLGGAVDGQPKHLGRRRQRCADVEHHLDVAPQQRLDLDR